MKKTISTKDKKILREKLFRHLEGFPIVACTAVLASKGVLNSFEPNKKVSLNDLAIKYKANAGYLAAALRILSSQGWLSQEVLKNGEDRFFTITDLGQNIFGHPTWFEMAYQFFPYAKKMDDFLDNKTSNTENEVFQTYFHEVENNWDIIATSPLSFLITPFNGVVLGSLLVSLGMRGEIEKWKKQDFKINTKSYSQGNWRLLFNFLEKIRWVSRKNNKFNFSNEAIFFLKRATAYGVTVSYLQTFLWLDELLFGKADILWDKPMHSPEIHVDRPMNVWGSGGAHAVYFEKIDEMIIDLFNKPIAEQPRGIADMGCGNGAFLAHLFQTVKNKTKRGEVLEEYPLLIIGSDYNEEAIEVTKSNLKEVGVEAHILQGDIGNPDALAAQLKTDYGVNLGEMLNVRSFLDHNRIFEPPQKSFSSREALGTGAYSFRGRRIPNNEIEQNLYEHFLKWKPYVKKFGLLVIELHTIDPEVAAQNIGKTAITAYDSTHSFTDQYIVEHDVFIAIANEVGLFPVQNCTCEYPNDKMTVVSINLLKEK